LGQFQQLDAKSTLTYLPATLFWEATILHRKLLKALLKQGENGRLVFGCLAVESQMQDRGA